MIGHKEVSRELNSDVGQPRKGNKDKKDILSIEIYYSKDKILSCCDIMLEIKDKKIFYLL